MARWTKYNNPHRKSTRKAHSPYSKAYREKQREEMYILLGKAETDAEKDAIIKAYNVSMYPY